MLESGTSRSPKTMALGLILFAASTQAGICPLASRSAQNWHFSTTPLDRVGISGFVGKLGFNAFGASRGSPQLKLLAPYGQAAMQNRHPMQRCMSIITIPSSLFHVALVGHALQQGGLVQ